MWPAPDPLVACGAAAEEDSLVAELKGGDSVLAQSGKPWKQSRNLLGLLSPKTSGWGLNQHTCLSPGAGGWKAKAKVSAGLASPGTSLLGLQITSPLCVCTSLCANCLFL